MLTVDDLHFSYGAIRKHRVFAGIHWELPPGKRTLLLGPNGAGKTTFLKLLAGFLRPSSGTVSLTNSQGAEVGVKDGVAWMPQHVRVVRGLSVKEQATYAAWLSGQDLHDAGASSMRALRDVQLVSKRNQLVKTLSGGQLRRLGLAEVLAVEAEVILLDEPTAGLDPAQRENFRVILNELPPKQGIVVSTHQVEDVYDFEHVTVLDQGKVKFDGTPSTFLEHGRSMGVSSESVNEIFARLIASSTH